MSDFHLSDEGRLANRIRRLFACSALLALVSCGGGGSSDSPGTPPAIAEGTLSPSVRLLTAEEEAGMSPMSASRVEFSRAVALQVNDVVVGREALFKVVSVSTTNGRTTVDTTEPAFEEVFSKLRIRGVFDVGSEEVTVAESWARPQAVGTSFSLSGDLAELGVEGSATVSGALVTDVDYDFDLSRGGLVSAMVDVSAQRLRLSSDIDVSVTFFPSERKLTLRTFRIPLPLQTIVGPAGVVLSPVLSRVVSIMVPVYVGLGAGMEFGGTFTPAIEMNGRVRLRYAEAGEPIVDVNTLTAERTLNFTSPIPAPSTQLQYFAGNIFVSAGVRPGLAFLNTVALAGADVALVGAHEGGLYSPTRSSLPNNCLVSDFNVQARIVPFYKAVGAASREFGRATRTLWESETAYTGHCVIDQTFEGRVISEGPATFYIVQPDVDPYNCVGTLRAEIDLRLHLSRPLNPEQEASGQAFVTGHRATSTTAPCGVNNYLNSTDTWQAAPLTGAIPGMLQYSSQTNFDWGVSLFELDFQLDFAVVEPLESVSVTATHRGVDTHFDGISRAQYSGAGVLQLVD